MRVVFGVAVGIAAILWVIALVSLRGPTRTPDRARCEQAMVARLRSEEALAQAPLSLAYLEWYSEQSNVARYC